MWFGACKWRWKWNWNNELGEKIQFHLCFLLSFQQFQAISRNFLAKWKWKCTRTSNELEVFEPFYLDRPLGKTFRNIT